MRWEKLGRIYDPEKYADAFEKKMSHGANPVPMLLHDDTYRIFFNVRDERSRAYVTYLDYDLAAGKVTSVPGKLLIEPGERGAFDDSGCSLGSVLEMGDEYYIYYLGWNLPRYLPFMNTIGMAVYNKKTDVCRKISAGPIMERNDVDPFSLSYPFVMKKGQQYQMWYGSHISWRDTTLDHNNLLHVIKYAYSEDGIRFKRDGVICIEGDGDKEYAFARPSVLLDGNGYRMWYAYRGEKYRIGYAESADGVTWTRKDAEAGIEPSDTEWESGEIAYPMVFRHKENLYMLYCGKRYGLTGFGIARQIAE